MFFPDHDQPKYEKNINITFGSQHVKKNGPKHLNDPKLLIQCSWKIYTKIKKNDAPPPTFRPSHRQIVTLWHCQREQYS